MKSCYHIFWLLTLVSLRLTNEIMGFTHDVFDPDMLLEEFRKQAQDHDEESDEKDTTPEKVQ